MTKYNIPTRTDLLWPTLKALESRGGSASIHELSDHLASGLALPDEILETLHKSGPQTEVEYRAAWARTDLRHIGAVENSSRGVWTITELGRSIRTETDLRELVRSKRRKWRQERRADDSLDEDGDVTTEARPWEDELLDIIRQISPNAFERLCQLVLRESGFTRVEVTGRSGDGGIDGVGVLRINLISFHVRFQCKRYSGSVGAPEIRDFRGAMVGRADKGLFMTSGGFTREAEREAVRDGAPAIDLINGMDLCDLLRNLRLGVTTETVERVTVKAEFFQGI